LEDVDDGSLFADDGVDALVGPSVDVHQEERIVLPDVDARVFKLLHLDFLQDELVLQLVERKVFLTQV